MVFIFIFATAGLLGWAVLKPWVVKWTGWGLKSNGRGPGGATERGGRYAPLLGEGEGEGVEDRGSDEVPERERNG